MEQRELLFNEEGKSFVSETKVNSDYNLHIEMESGGTLEIYQRGSDEGKYRRSYIELKWGDVIDADFCNKQTTYHYEKKLIFYIDFNFNYVLVYFLRKYIYGCLRFRSFFC